MPSIPTQVTFRGLPHSDALESEVRDRAAWLGHFHPRVERCHVLIELPHRHRQDGRQVHVRIELAVPGGPPIVVSHEPSRHGALQDAETGAYEKELEVAAVRRDATTAIHEVFNAARRRLQDFARERRGDVKTHRAPSQGR